MRETRAVYRTPSSGGMYNVRIALNQRVPGEARNAIAAVFGWLANAKHVFVVDPDIDVFSDEQIDWAFATRFQADRDLVVASGMRTLPLDPSLGGAATGAKAGFDLTCLSRRQRRWNSACRSRRITTAGASIRSRPRSKTGRSSSPS